ncbi:ornithine carbamoyltransferase [Acuticoccus sp. M5D2P5]|uniref:ornithine carbamoyltransferase n=1 Tax=Acuticoccus kalidii TaxID=2910977 RepID=UPI001F1E8369|nr:ornithine carbamoyltransferase [Acuticoccus kalidii]MCF3933925.1 ornithine carbamoyltransferase [Acuticoccus kalidii]
MTIRHFLDIASHSPATLRAILDEAHRLKANGRGRLDLLPGRTLAMLFEQVSTRTRFSFDLAMRELGGDTIIASGGEMQLGRGETLGDTAAVLSRYVDAIMIRMLDHEGLVAFAEEASVPVINGLTRRSHPCQILADIMTIEERLGPIEARTVAWVGDGNNVAATFVEAARRLGFRFKIATPVEYDLAEDVVTAAKADGSKLEVGRDPYWAVKDADVVVTDTWTSMGDVDEDRRRSILTPFRVDDALMAAAAPGAIFLHCLPAHRGDEVTDSVMDGPQSAVFDEAENRVHAQKAVLAWCFRAID